MLYLSATREHYLILPVSNKFNQIINRFVLLFQIIRNVEKQEVASGNIQLSFHGVLF